MNTKRFTILHSNDIHGDFQAELDGAEGHLIGGLSLLSGYINQVRQEEENVLYIIAGDMVQGSMIDSEFKGVSTMELMNYLAPDVATLGNHELDYGLGHLLFLEKMANFPIVVANLYIKQYHKRLMQPYHIVNVAGFDIMFIGIITQEILQALKMDTDIGTFLTLEEASDEAGRICNAYKDEDIDLTVLLTHIGFESDKRLATMLNPEWGVDLIIGGHSHTILEEPAIINDILITQAGVGSDQIGRFDIIVDDDTNSIVEWQWQLLPVDSTLAEPDEEFQAFIDTFQQVVDRKYNTMICRLAQKLTHPLREEETALGNLFADILAQSAHADIAFVGSGSIRGTQLGPIVTLGDLRRIYAYDGALYRFAVTGAQLTQIFTHIMRPDNRIPGESQCQQVSRGVRAVYNDTTRSLESLAIDGQPVRDDQQYTICLQEFHMINAAANMGITGQELREIAGPHVATTSIREVLEEYLRHHQNLNSKVESRLVYTS
ncbi:MAG: bifunctional UDP-sugar hydrolase/5'-nucleotidase [Chloroflexota bacterium]|nr:bifunctional UDP-sugar hydrolase/5'-nucleotidase [Chloroflexota bacterium]